MTFEKDKEILKLRKQLDRLIKRNDELVQCNYMLIPYLWKIDKKVETLESQLKEKVKK